jgi:hypothetical protein
MHEIGHNLNLGHAGGFTDDKNGFYEYKDGSVMGVATLWDDFTAVSRYHLGCIDPSQAGHLPGGAGTALVALRALNEGPFKPGTAAELNADGAYLTYMIRCDFCADHCNGAQDECENPTPYRGGFLYLSLRTNDEGTSRFGAYPYDRDHS